MEQGNNSKMEAKTMFIRWIMLIVFTGAVALLPACGTGTRQSLREESMLDKNWGRSFEAQKYNQILHPDAGKDVAPVAGLDGQAALKAMEKYHEGDGSKGGGSPEFGILSIKK
jgi:hypothetical protein